MPAPAILIPQTWGQAAALSDRALVQGRSSAWRIGILPPNGYGIRTGLFAHWRLDENGGTTAYDSSAHGHHLTTLTDIAWATGVAGYCVELNGATSVASGAIGALGNAWTFAAWVCLDAWPADYSMAISIDEGDGTALFIGAYTVGGNKKFRMRWRDTSPATQAIVSTNNYGTAVWHHICATHSGMTTILYVNGVADGSDLVHDSRAYLAGTAFVGARSLIQYFLDGKIDEPYILKRALAPDEVRQLYYSPDGYIDYSSMLVNNQVQLGARGSVLKPAEAAQATFSLRNNQQVFMEGDLAGAGVRVRQAIQNVTDLMDYGDCEHATQGPMMLGDTGSNDTATATLDRDLSDWYRGAASYRFTKLNAAGTLGQVNLYSTTGMHGCVPGGKVTFSFRIKIPTAEIANWIGQTLYMNFGEYYAGAWHNTTAVYLGTASENVWRLISGTVTLNTATERTMCFLATSPGVPINAFALVDDLPYSCSLPYDTTLPVRQWLQMFTGYVSPEGCRRTKGSLTEDTVALSCFDPVQRKGMNRKCKAQAVLSYMICDPADPVHSLLHLLAGQMGLTVADLDVDTIADVKDYIGFDRTKYTWQLLQNLALAHGALLAFRYDGKLRLKVWTAADWAAAVPEFVFDSTNIRREWTGKSSPVACNNARMEFSFYQVLPVGSIIYKNYEEWDETLGRNAITVHAGEYWPIAADAQGVAQLQYQYGQERYPIGINIIVPTIGVVNSGSDIEATGALTLISFNGSTADTQQNLDSSEIILRNNTGGDIVITKMELRGTPIREVKKLKVETVTATDGSTPADSDVVEQTIPGDFATTAARAQITCLRWVDFGHLPRDVFEFDADFTPQLQIGAIVRFHPDATTDVIGVVVGYQHSTVGPWSLTSKTHVQMVERVNFSAAGSGKVRSWSAATPPTGVDPVHGTYVCVGGAGSTGRFDYVASGTADEGCIQAAVDAVSVFGGGTVELVGTFFLEGPVLLRSNIVLKMDGAQIIKDGDFEPLVIVGTAGTHLTNVRLIGGVLASDAGDTNNRFMILADYVDRLLIQNIDILDSPSGAISIANATNFLVHNAKIQKWNRIGAAAGRGIIALSPGIISACTLDGELVSVGFATGIRGEGCIISECTVQNMKGNAECFGILALGPATQVEKSKVLNLTSTGAGPAIPAGIITTGSRAKIAGNIVIGVKNTAAGSARGIVVGGGTDSMVDDNYCYDNGVDAGIANTGGNFFDAGVTTRVGNNSWQL